MAEEDALMADHVDAGDEEQEEEAGPQKDECSQHQLLKLMVAPAIISIHPASTFVVVSVGAGFRVFDLERNERVNPDDSTSIPGHRAAIRAARFDHDGGCFVSAGDDKLVKVWDVPSWKCSKTILVNKKTSAVAFSRDGQWLMVADKFGVVYVIPTKSEGEAEKPAQLLAHCCCIITSLETSPCGKFVVTADRDFKIRVSVLPKKPMLGAFEIQSFCLGHTSFVSCISFLVDKSSSQSLLVSGGGDATIRLWDYVAGVLLDTLELTNVLKVEEAEEDDASAPAVLNITSNASVIAASAERFAGMLLVRCDFETKKLSLLQKITLQEYIYPTGLQFDPKGRLWLIAGAAETREVGDRALTPEQVAEMAAEAQATAAAALTRVRVVQKVSESESEYEVLQDAQVPSGTALLEALQGRLDSSSSVVKAAKAAELAMKNLLSKRQYSESHREKRKRSRNDKKASVPAVRAAVQFS